MGGFQIIPHTADVGLRVWGKHWKDLLEEAALGMMSQITDLETIHPETEKVIEAKGETGDEVLLNWLREILFHVERGMIFSKFNITEDNFSDKQGKHFKCKGLLVGEAINPSRHEICIEIKAVTRHGLSIKKQGPWWVTSILFDV